MDGTYSLNLILDSFWFYSFRKHIHSPTVSFGLVDKSWIGKQAKATFISFMVGYLCHSLSYQMFRIVFGSKRVVSLSTIQWNLKKKIFYFILFIFCLILFFSLFNQNSEIQFNSRSSKLLANILYSWTYLLGLNWLMRWNGKCFFLESSFWVALN